METVVLVGEGQIKSWIREVVREALKEIPREQFDFPPDEESFISRKDAASRLGISLVILNA